MPMSNGMMGKLVARAMTGAILPPILRALVSLIAFVAVPVLSAGLNDTGITACGDASTTSANCATVSADGGSFPRQDGRYGRDAQAGGAGFDFSKIANDGSVLPGSAALGTNATDWACSRDNVTGLIWEVKTSSGLRSQSYTYKWYQRINGQGVGVASKNSDPITCQTAGHCDTDQYVTDVNREGLCGFNDWRMPTVKELEDIVYFSRLNPPIDTTYFPNTQANYYWTGTNDALFPGQFAWIIDFMAGAAAKNQPSVPQYVRLVRGTPATSTYTLVTLPNGDAAVTDSRTGLMWKRDHEMVDPTQPNDWQSLVNAFSWQTALQRAVNDRTGGYSDWRLPNIKELRSLVDETRHNPAIDPVFTPTPFQSWFWSSSPYTDPSGNQNWSMVVGFDLGTDQATPRSYIQHVRLVRGGDAFDKFGSANPAGPYALSVTRLGTGSGTVNSNPTGISCGTLCSASFASGTSVTLSATADASSTFTGWSGGGCSGTGTCTVSMNQAQNVSAIFASDSVGSYTLTVTPSGAGTGTVISNPAGINCGATCSASYSSGSSVTLSATVSASNTFSGWNGGGCSGTGTCTVLMNQAQNVSATFTVNSVNGYTLTVTELGAGSGTVTSSPAGINCGALCSAFFASGSSATLSATAGMDSTFAGWSGAGCSGTGTCTVSMNQTQNVSATFTSNSVSSYTLTVTQLGTGTGTVTSSPAGINCGALCSVFFASGTRVTLSATADTGSTFTGWSGGGCSGTGTCTVLVNQIQSVSATFTSNSVSGYTLNVFKWGTGTGTVTGLNINCGAVCSVVYPSGTSVTLSATVDVGSTFGGWSGGGCSGTGTCTVNMYQMQNVSATFTSSASANSYTLTVTELGTGTGTVTSSPSGINCGALCSVFFPSGTSVTLSASADAGSTFTGWSGGGCSGTSSCTVSMNQAQNVTATFSSSGYALNVTKSGTGSGTLTSSPGGISCGATCSASYNSGTSVVLSATAAAGSTFTGWSGACSGTIATCTVIMSQAQSVTATFTVNSYPLSVTKSGTGTGTVTAANINCGSVCSVVYPGGTSVTLSATADAGSTFTGWSGACSGTTATCTLSMSQAQSVTATFTVNSYTLSVAKSGGGSGTVVSSPAGVNCGSLCSVPFATGTSVTLSATAAAGSTFAGWSGAGCSGIGSCTVSMNQAQSVIATFTLVLFSSASPYDGIYQWDAGYFLSMHQIGASTLIGTIYWVYNANTEHVGARTISEADTFDLLQGQLVGSTATMTGTRFYRACTLSYDFTFNSDATLTVRRKSVSNSPGVSAADVDCATKYNSGSSFWTIPRIL